MKQVIFIAILIFAFCFGAFAQTNKIVSNKVAVINSDMFFDEEFGIKELVDEYKKFDGELDLRRQELKILSLKIQALKKDMPIFQNYPQAFQAKLEELEQMHRDYNRIQEDLNYRPKERKRILMLRFKIREALVQFKKEKGYVIIVDNSSSSDSSMIMDENEIPSIVTSEFIRFYNKNFVKTDSR